ncbi:MAG: VWA domain-containing protein [Flavobacteriaceae bacterium]|nr:VWA domain-containing protein [Flavobacteriaceae bacterium]
MSIEILLYIFLIGIVALTLAVLMYGYKETFSIKNKILFSSLRFISLFAIGLLLINPSLNTTRYTIEKPQLILAVDNSASVKHLQQDKAVTSLVESLKENSDLNKAFDLSVFSFDTDLNTKDSLVFDGKQTDISKALSRLDRLYKNSVAPIVLISDGNQTLGTDFQFLSKTLKQPVYSVILGDTIVYSDLKINQLNVNKYSFLNNKFPVEVIISYSGKEDVRVQFVVKRNNTIVYKQSLKLSALNNSQILSFTLPASSVGLKQYSAEIQPLAQEKNTSNNIKRFAIEVIDQSTNVLIVSDMSHPDIGALKKAINSNEQRSSKVVKPEDALALLDDFQLVVLYQPTSRFKDLYDKIKAIGLNTLTITGTHTDWELLNALQKNFYKTPSLEEEEVGPQLNLNYGTFAFEDTGFNNFPPLQTSFGEITMLSPHEVLFEQVIDGIITENTLMATYEFENKRGAILDGQGFWRWRAQSYLENQDFKAFDNFIGGLVQFLASNSKKSRLTVSAEPFYYNTSDIKVTAQYFDKNYQFNKKGKLNISLINKADKTKTTVPFLLKNNFYEVNLSNLKSGNYTYKISIKDEASFSRSGHLSIIDFNVEQQFLNANVKKLKALSEQTKAQHYFINNSSQLVSTLLNDIRFIPVQKSEQKSVPLLDWKYLLAIIIAALSAEWFIRKYNGLI